MRLLTIAMVGMALALSGCQTIDLDNFEPFSGDQVEQNIFENQCPKIKIVNELSELSEFIDISDPSEYNLVSNVKLDLNESSCNYRGANVSVDLKLAFNSRLGPRGRLTDKDKPFFSYPFFVAVTNPQGNILAKEVFGASMTYKRGEETHIYFENLRQIIPIPNPDKGRHYEILIGFQLTPTQLAYNRSGLMAAGEEFKGGDYRPMNVTPQKKPR